MPYITSTITRTHTAMHDVVVDKVLEKKNATSASVHSQFNLCCSSFSKVDHLFQNPLIYLAVLLLALSVWFKMRFTDPYGLFHLTLNKLPSEDPNSPPLTEWLNMGYWKVGHALTLHMVEFEVLKTGYEYIPRGL